MILLALAYNFGMQASILMYDRIVHLRSHKIDLAAQLILIVINGLVCLAIYGALGLFIKTKKG